MLEAMADAADYPGQPSRRRRDVRWMDTGITLLLCGAVGAVLFVATPPLLRAAGVAPTLRTAGGPVRGVRLRPARDDAPFFPNDDELMADEEAPLRGPAGLRGLPRPDEQVDRAPALEPDAHGDSDGGVRLGLVRRGVKLVDQPHEGGEVIGEIGSGETVMLVKDAGEWVLVVHSGKSDLSMGWTRRSEIAVR